MSVLSEYDRFIAVQNRSIERLQAKILRRRMRGKETPSAVKALGEVEEALGRTRVQRAHVEELFAAGLALEFKLADLFQMMQNPQDEALLLKVADEFDLVNQRFSKALVTVGSPA